MNTAPDSIHQLEQQSYDYGYAYGLSKHGELCSIIEDMAALFVMLSPQESTRPNVKRAEAAYRKYLSITTHHA